MKKMSKRTFRFDVKLKVKKIGSEKRLYILYNSFIFVCRNGGLECRKGREPQRRTLKAGGLPVCEGAK